MIVIFLRDYKNTNPGHETAPRIKKGIKYSVSIFKKKNGDIIQLDPITADAPTMFVNDSDFRLSIRTGLIALEKE
ncbi:MAG TPA: hypothetical protein PKL44_00235 [Candidatus Dojkabacteria bacterium]|nr:hypothetical protein [Candidatus Dojkabacteria bacterium]